MLKREQENEKERDRKGVREIVEIDVYIVRARGKV